MTKYLDLRSGYKKEDLLEAAEYIKRGKLVLFPTETVYGIGANGLNNDSVKKIFVAKNRAQDNPLILHISNLKMIDQIADGLSELEKKIINDFFPGPLTIILKRKSIVPNSVTAGLDTVGVRMPSNKIARDLIELSNTPIAAPSANISGKPSGTNIQDIFQELNNKAEEFVAKGDYDSAINRLQASLDLDATLYQTYYNLGIAQTKAKKYPEAIATFEAGIKVKPDFKDFYYSLATAQLSYYEDLEEFVEDSLKSDDAKKAEVNDAENNIKMTKDEAKKLSEELKKSALENLNKFLATDGLPISYINNE